MLNDTTPLAYKSQDGQAQSLKSQTYCSYVFFRPSLCRKQADPDVTLAGLRAPSIAVAFSPVLYALDPKKQNRTNLHYR